MCKVRFRRSRTDYPKGVIGIYDTGNDKFVDRYTVVYEPYKEVDNTFVYSYVTMSADPFWPLGFCQHGSDTCRPVASWGNNGGCGKVIRFEDLPEDCQKVVIQDLGLIDNGN